MSEKEQQLVGICCWSANPIQSHL